MPRIFQNGELEPDLCRRLGLFAGRQLTMRWKRELFQVKPPILRLLDLEKYRLGLCGEAHVAAPNRTGRAAAVECLQRREVVGMGALAEFSVRKLAADQADDGIGRRGRRGLCAGGNRLLAARAGWVGGGRRLGSRRGDRALLGRWRSPNGGGLGDCGARSVFGISGFR